MNSEKKLPTVEVIKAADLRFDGNHPNNINEGYSKKGTLYQLEVGKPCLVGSFHTSTVISITPDGAEFTTRNSIYKIKYLD